jgi:hypothetical protein
VILVQTINVRDLKLEESVVSRIDQVYQWHKTKELFSC